MSRRNLLLWALALTAALPNALRLDDRLAAAGLPPTGESARARAILSEQFGSPFARYAVMVAPDLERADGDAGRGALRPAIEAVAALPFVTAMISPVSALDTLLVGAGGNGAVAVVGIATGVAPDHAIPALRAAAAAAAPALRLLWTGEAAIDHDLRRAGADALAAAELVALPLSLVVALWAFRGVAGAVVAVATGGAAVLLALGLLSVLATAATLTLLARGITSLLALALGIDYALLLLWRWREDGRPGVLEAGRTIAIAAFVVAAGLAPLVLLPVAELRSAGIAALVGVAAAALAARTLTPVLLAWLPRHEHGTVDAAAQRWRRVAARVIRRPWLTLAVTLPPLVALAAPTTGLRPVVHGADWLPRSMESARALDELAAMNRLGAALGLRVLLLLPEHTSVLEPAGWAALQRVHATLEREPRVGGVRSLISATGGLPLATVRDVLPERVARSFVSQDRRIAVLELALASDLDPAGAGALTADLRRLDAGALSLVPGARIVVGGAAATNVDYAAAIIAAIPATAILVIAGSFLILAVAFRALLVPVKAVALNLLTVGVALGAATMVFQPTLGGIFPTVLILAFCAAWGAGMDYEVFLLRRVAALRDHAESVREGVAHTAGVITGAAATMVTVFIVFAAAGLAPLRVLGFVLAVAIAVDATVIRLVVAPALLTLAGRWNWWPARSLVADGRSVQT